MQYYDNDFFFHSNSLHGVCKRKKNEEGNKAITYLNNILFLISPIPVDIPEFPLDIAELPGD